MKLKGKVWKFGDYVNTDLIIPFRFKSRTNDPYELARYCMYGIDPEFPNKISKGDIIVAGKNFAGGSSREQAPIAIKYAGIAAVVAESFSRIFTRNCFAIGLPIFVVKDITKHVNQGDDIEADVDKLSVRVNGREFKAEDWPGFLKEILKAGGLQEYYKKHKKFPWE